MWICDSWIIDCKSRSALSANLKVNLKVPNFLAIKKSLFRCSVLSQYCSYKIFTYIATHLRYFLISNFKLSTFRLLQFNFIFTFASLNISLSSWLCSKNFTTPPIISSKVCTSTNSTHPSTKNLKICSIPIISPATAFYCNNTFTPFLCNFSLHLVSESPKLLVTLYKKIKKWLLASRRWESNFKWEKGDK